MNELESNKEKDGNSNLGEIYKNYNDDMTIYG